MAIEELAARLKLAEELIREALPVIGNMGSDWGDDMHAKLSAFLAGRYRDTKNAAYTIEQLLSLIKRIVEEADTHEGFGTKRAAEIMAEARAIAHHGGTSAPNQPSQDVAEGLQAAFCCLVKLMPPCGMTLACKCPICRLGHVVDRLTHPGGASST